MRAFGGGRVGGVEGRGRQGGGTGGEESGGWGGEGGVTKQKKMKETIKFKRCVDYYYWYVAFIFAYEILFFRFNRFMYQKGLNTTIARNSKAPNAPLPKASHSHTHTQPQPRGPQSSPPTLPPISSLSTRQGPPHHLTGAAATDARAAARDTRMTTGG